jgi:hypothetical protein
MLGAQKILVNGPGHRCHRWVDIPGKRATGEVESAKGTLAPIIESASIIL